MTKAAKARPFEEPVIMTRTFDAPRTKRIENGRLGMSRRAFLTTLACAGLSLAVPASALAQTKPDASPRASTGTAMAKTAPKAGYASVNGLKMYYEIHGTGRPLVVLHGAFMSIDLMGPVVPALAKTRQVIAVELQGHGRTADIDRPLNYEQMADDTAALLRHFKVRNADIFGYSMGGAVALQIAMRHPDLVRKLVVAAVSYTSGGIHPGVLEGIATITPEAFAGTPWEADYAKKAPNPQDWPKLIEKVKQLDANIQDWSAESIRAIKAPTLIMIGDSDIVRPEHAVEMFRLRGGGVAGDVVGLPDARLAVLPGTTHVSLIQRTDWLRSMIAEFLDAPMREAK